MEKNAEDGRKLLQPFFEIGPSENTVDLVPYPVVNTLQNFLSTHGHRKMMDSVRISSFTPLLFEKLINTLKSCPIHDGGFGIIMDFFGATVTSRVKSKDTAFPLRDTVGKNVVISRKWREPKDDEEMRLWSCKVVDAFEDVRLEGVYSNYHESGKKASSFYGKNLERLQKVKQLFDPQNFFHINRNIQPSTTG